MNQKLTDADITQKVFDVIVTITKINRSALELQSKLIGGGFQVNSIQLIELVVGLENAFGIELGEDYLVEDNFKDPESIIKMVNSFNNLKP